MMTPSEKVNAMLWMWWFVSGYNNIYIEWEDNN